MEEKALMEALSRSPLAALGALRELAKEGVSPASAGFGARDARRMIEACASGGDADSASEAATALMWGGEDAEGVWLEGWRMAVSGREEDFGLLRAEIRSWEGKAAAEQIGERLGEWIEAGAARIEEDALEDLLLARGGAAAFRGERGARLAGIALAWGNGKAAEAALGLQEAGALGAALRAAEDLARERKQAGSVAEDLLRELCWEGARASGRRKERIGAALGEIAEALAREEGPAEAGLLCGLLEAGEMEAFGILGRNGAKLPGERGAGMERMGLWVGSSWASFAPEWAGREFPASEAVGLLEASRALERASPSARELPEWDARGAREGIKALGLPEPTDLGARVLESGLLLEPGNPERQRALADLVRLSGAAGGEKGPAGKARVPRAV